MFATLFFGVLDLKSGRLVYINGGHEAVSVIDQNGVRERLVPAGPAVGLLPEAKFEYKEVRLLPGEILFAYTDGVIDALSPGKERFTKRRLFSLLSQPAASARNSRQRLPPTYLNTSEWPGRKMISRCSRYSAKIRLDRNEVPFVIKTPICYTPVDREG